MPEADEPSEADVAEIVRAVNAGEDEIDVPPELLDDAKTPAAPASRSLYAEILAMPVAQKIKLALRGNQDARTILIRDASKLIRRFVLLNPRMTDGEVIAVARNKSADDELLRTIAARRDWMRLYQVRLGLATNPKTALPTAIRLVNTLDTRDLQHIAKSKNVPAGIAAHARRLLLTTRAVK
jgi:hypothetical protein